MFARFICYTKNIQTIHTFIFRLQIVIYKQLKFQKLIKKPKTTYKTLRSHFFSVLYKKIYFNSNYKPKFKIVKKDQIKKFNYKVYTVQNCRIYTNCVENVSIIKNNQLI